VVHLDCVLEQLAHLRADRLMICLHVQVGAVEIIELNAHVYALGFVACERQLHALRYQFLTAT